MSAKIVTRIELTSNEYVVLTVKGHTILGKIACPTYFHVPEPVTVGSGVLSHKTARRIRWPRSATEIGRITPLPGSNQITAGIYGKGLQPASGIACVASYFAACHFRPEKITRGVKLPKVTESCVDTVHQLRPGHAVDTHQLNVAQSVTGQKHIARGVNRDAIAVCRRTPVDHGCDPKARPVS